MTRLYRTLLGIKTGPPPGSHQVTFTVKEWFFDPDNSFTDTEVGILEYMTVKIVGEDEKLTNASGQAVFDLLPGTYTYEVYDMVRYLTTRKGTITVVDAAVSVDVKIYACLYTPSQVDNMINPPAWTAGTYDEGWQVEHNSVIYQAGVETTEEPGSGTDWVVSSKYIPVASATELDGLRNATGRRMGQGTIHDTVSNVVTGLDKKYVQVTDIDTYSLPEFSVVGLFSGLFDGNQIQTKTNKRLFLSNGCILKNITVFGVVDSQLIPLTDSGCLLVAVSSNSTNDTQVINCHGYGEIYQYEDITAQAGLIAFSNSTYNVFVTTCSFTGYIKSSVGNTGGLIGSGSRLIVTDCHVDVVVDSTSINVGGLIGAATGNCSVIKCSAKGGVKSTATGTVRFGGFIGRYITSGSINNCTTSVICELPNGNYVGGFVGVAGSGTNISNSYSTGAVISSSSFRGGFAALRNGTITNSYYDTQTSGQSDTGKGLPRTTAQMQAGTASSFINPDGTIDETEDPANAMYTGWDTDIWDFLTTNDYPELK